VHRNGNAKRRRFSHFSHTAIPPNEAGYLSRRLLSD
jgi:hypothetical protein